MAHTEHHLCKFVYNIKMSHLFIQIQNQSEKREDTIELHFITFLGFGLQRMDLLGAKDFLSE